MNAKTLLERMPRAVDKDALRDTNAVIQYEISEPVYQVVENGELTVHEGRADAPDVIITIADEDLVKLLSGELNAMAAFMSGKLKLQGDMMLAQRLVSVVDREELSKLA